ncbi:MAG: GH3 auxin-responsive promoter family protein [Anaerovoracaceae bacterium]
MKFEEKLKNKSPKEIWNEYCGFLDLSIDQFMDTQLRLMEEQLNLWKNSTLGKGLLKNKNPESIDEFREMFPLTKYDDYAELLLQKREEALPDTPIIWIQTTWEGGTQPVKVAPYTKAMLNTYKNNVLACMILGTSKERGNFNVKNTDTFLYGLAPLPFATGLYPRALNDEISIKFLPPVNEAEKMSFGERNKKGFKLGLTHGIDYFFGLGSVAYFISLSLMAAKDKGSTKTKHSFRTIRRYLRAKRICKKENRELMPKDLFSLKAFMVAGTDNNCYKDELEKLWGVRPMELFAGTEPSIIGTETWTRNGMYFFPDTCFYEFIPEEEMEKSFEDESYIPKTCLMNQVIEGEKYELVISVLKGGAFMRYRVGDVYRCVGLRNKEDQTNIPRFKYIDRVTNIIDIAGFTRISEKTISNAINLSNLPIKDWTAKKEYTNNNKPFMHLYVEMEPEAFSNLTVSKEILKEHLTIYFKYVDHDYKDLKLILGMDPLEITIVKCGTFLKYQESEGKEIRRINPKSFDMLKLMEVNDNVC